MRTHQDDRYAMFHINRRISWFAKRLGIYPDGSRFGVKPLKEAVRNAKTPTEVYDLLNEFEAGGLRGGWFDANSIYQDSMHESPNA